MGFIEGYYWLMENWVNIVEVISYIIAIASIIVKWTPTLKDDNYLKSVVKFLSKYIALNYTITPEEQEKVNNK